MSLNLTLIPEQFRYQPGDELLAYIRLNLTLQNSDLFRRIEAEASPFGDSVLWYDDEGLETRTADQYDTPLTWIPAPRLIEILCDGTVTFRGLDVAIIAFVRAMPPTSRVILWWC